MFKRTLGGLLLVLIVCFGFSSHLWAEDENVKQKMHVPESFLCWEEMLSYFDGNICIERDTTENQILYVPLESNFPSLTAINGFDQRITINGVSYFAKYISNAFIKSNAGPVEDVKFVISVANGETQSTTTSVMTCSSYKISATVKLLDNVLKNFGITAGLDYNYQKCKTVTKGTVYTFPSNCAGYNTAAFYIGTAFDLYKYTYDIAPLISNLAARRECIRGCRPTKDPDIQQRCIDLCNSQNPDYPDLSKISRYEVEIYIPRPISWSVCSIGPGNNY